MSHLTEDLAFLVALDPATLSRKMEAHGPAAERRIREIQTTVESLAEDWSLVPRWEVDDLTIHIGRVAAFLRDSVQQGNFNRSQSAEIQSHLTQLAIDLKDHLDARGLLPGQLRTAKRVTPDITTRESPNEPRGAVRIPEVPSKTYLRRGAVRIAGVPSKADLSRLEQQVAALQGKIARIEEDRASIDLREAGDAVRAARDAAKEANDAASAAKDAAGISAVTTSGSFYEARAAAHDASADSWRKATVGAVVLTAFVALTFVAITLTGAGPDSRDLGAVIQYAVERIVALAALGALSFWTSRQMSAHQHNAVVNHQKATAMRTFEAFAKEAKDPETKRAVVLEASRSIYSVQATGWSEGDDGAYRPPLLQVIGAADGARQAVTEPTKADK